MQYTSGLPQSVFIPGSHTFILLKRQTLDLTARADGTGIRSSLQTSSGRHWPLCPGGFNLRWSLYIEGAM